MFTMFALSKLIACSYFVVSINSQCQSNEIACVDTTLHSCVSDTWVCDGDNDCGDCTDEPTLCPSVNIAPSCASQSSVPTPYPNVPTLYYPTSNSYDQTDCDSTQYKCKGDGMCIPNSYICDNYVDCSQGDDEENCYNYGDGHDGSTGNSSVGCSDDQFKCNSGYCIPDSYLCDGYDDCPSGEDETNATCTSAYTCKFQQNKLTVGSLIDKSNDFGSEQQLSKEDAQDIIDGATDFAKSGVDVQDNLVLISLLFMNVITAVFIIIGLHKYEQTTGFKDDNGNVIINISYITLLIVILQHLLITSINLFATPVVKCTVNKHETISGFDIAQYICSTVLWLIWISYSSSGKCSKVCIGIAVVFFTFFVPLILAVSSQQGIIISRWIGSGVVYTLCQMFLPVFWALIVTKFPETMSWSCNKGLCQACKCCQNACCCVCNGIVAFMMQVVAILMMVGIISAVSDNANTCLIMGGTSWFNPMWIILNIILLFSAARYPIIMYNVIMIAISIMGSRHGFMCFYVVNVQFVAHALLIPVYTIVIFFSVKKLRPWIRDLIQMYLVSFDVVTDVIVIYYFIQNKHYIFAICSTVFILLGQIVGSFSDNCTSVTADKLTRGDKILALFGFSGPWFLIKSWSDMHYFILEHKHQIWEIMFENMPGVALQIYASLTTQGAETTSLGISIIVSIVTISFSVWMYLVKLTKLKREKLLLEDNLSMSIRHNNALEDNDNPHIQPNAGIELTTAQNPQESAVTTATATQNTEASGETLPEGWRIAYTENNRKYYQNDSTQQTSWTMPKPESSNAKEQIEEHKNEHTLPAGWICLWTPDGKEYFQYEKTKQTQWERPTNETEINEIELQTDTQSESLPSDWRAMMSPDGKIYYENDKTKQTQWQRPVQHVAVALNESDDDEHDYNKDTQKETGKTETVKQQGARKMTKEEMEYEQEMKKLEKSSIIPAIIRKTFGDVIINSELYLNLYFFMITDLYIRSMSLIIFISSIPCPTGESYCLPRISIGGVIFVSLLIFEFVMNRKIRTGFPEYQKCGFISSIFAVTLLSSFYTTLSTLNKLKDDEFFGKCVNFHMFLFEHKIRIIISILMWSINIVFFAFNDWTRNEFVIVLLVVFCGVLVINYWTINKVGKYVDHGKKYTFRICSRNTKSDSNVNDDEPKKTPAVIQGK